VSIIYNQNTASIQVTCDWLFTVLRPAQEYFTFMETSPLPVKGCKIYARRPGPLNREGSLSCHICCDTGPRFFRSHPKDRPIQSPLATQEGMWRIYSNPDPLQNQKHHNVGCLHTVSKLAKSGISIWISKYRYTGNLNKFLSTYILSVCRILIIWYVFVYYMYEINYMVCIRILWDQLYSMYTYFMRLIIWYVLVYYEINYVVCIRILWD
jgi:hypothetical protein